MEFSKDDRVFTELGLEQHVQGTGRGRGVGFRVEGFGDGSVLLNDKR